MKVTLKKLQLFKPNRASMRAFAFILVLFFIASCKKDKTEPPKDIVGPPCLFFYDTLIVDFEKNLEESSPWLAAYPGSWWKLSNGDTLTCSLDEFELTEFVENNEDDCVTIFNKTVWSGARIEGSNSNYFPKGFIDGDFRIIIDYLGLANRYQTMNTPYINDLNTSSWTVFSYIYEHESGATTSHLQFKHLVEFYDSYELPNGDVYEDVAHIEFRVEITDGDSYLILEDMYYAKDVGLIRYFQPENEISGHLELDIYVDDYYIAPH